MVLGHLLSSSIVRPISFLSNLALTYHCSGRRYTPRSCWSLLCVARIQPIQSHSLIVIQVHRNEAKIVNEQNVGRGVVEVDDSWAFGQVLSVVMIIANVNELVHFLFAFQARRSRRRQLPSESQAQEEGTAHQDGGPPVVGYQSRGPYGSSTSSSKTLSVPLRDGY